MRAHVVYESMFGNSHAVADAVAAGIRAVVPGAEVVVVNVMAAPDDLRPDLLVVDGGKPQLTAAMRRAPLLQVVSDELCWGLGYEPVTDRPLEVRFECRCTDRRALEALAYFTPEEREQMIAEDGGAEVVCHWCGERRWIEPDQIRSLSGAELRCPECDSLWHREGQPAVYRHGERCACGRPVELPA